ncbi:hypothetical protein LCL96_02275 [Rossellomorea aquimaris]|uniref:hypothetical protein n=1 Tax=Rossellomorea aquimaris TaxID=189382 RepID=UPI001CD3D7AB|nr:hypothetical protein [Rossellomorea aquimaris]MCA1057739.1 hypothetical protein [Rossellomorea aquimaris]
MFSKKRMLASGFILFIILFAILDYKSPTSDEFEQWMLKENDIECTENGGVKKCMKNNRVIWGRSGHYRNVGFFSSYERDYEYDTGEQITFRTFGFLGKIIPMEDGRIWGIVN